MFPEILSHAWANNNPAASSRLVNQEMKKALQLVAACVSVCALPSCTMTPDEHYVRQIIPIKIQSGRPVTVEIILSGNGANHVGVRCSPQVWSELAKDPKKITVQLRSSTDEHAEIGGIAPGSGKQWPIEAFYYLFYISGDYHAKASVEITFPNAPPGTTPAEIIVCKTPPDTGL